MQTINKIKEIFRNRLVFYAERKKLLENKEEILKLSKPAIPEIQRRGSKFARSVNNSPVRNPSPVLERVKTAYVEKTRGEFWKSKSEKRSSKRQMITSISLPSLKKEKDKDKIQENIIKYISKNLEDNCTLKETSILWSPNKFRNPKKNLLFFICINIHHNQSILYSNLLLVRLLINSHIQGKFDEI